MTLKLGVGVNRGKLMWAISSVNADADTDAWYGQGLKEPILEEPQFLLRTVSC